MMHARRLLVINLGLLIASQAPAASPSVEPTVVLEHDDGDFLWFHPRAASIPDQQGPGKPFIVMTLQKHLFTSDYYSGLYVMTSRDLGQTWSGPTEVPALAWQKDDTGATVAVCDVTPGWHAPSQRLIAFGVKVRYDTAGKQLEEVPRSNEVAYAVYDPAAERWSQWRWLELPDRDGRFFLARQGCSQWIVKEDGSLLVPVYHKGKEGTIYSTTVVRCTFDGAELTLAEVGETLSLSTPRGIYEPSLIEVAGTYYLTLRHDARGYVTRSRDGLHYEPIKAWQFDDSSDLGSYNTQQHWLAHGDDLWLVYTRRGAENDHIMRHRAPLFMAKVDREHLHVLRATEQIVVPERGATLGNFGAAAITAKEAWVTVAEGVWNDQARERGATGAFFIARIRWTD